MSTDVEADESRSNASSVITSEPVPDAWPKQAKLASRQLAVARGAAKNAWLSRSAGRALRERRDEILAANARDVAAAPAHGLNAAAIDRLTLESQADRRDGPDACATSPRCPTRSARSSTSSRRPNGLEVSQVRVPLGVIFMIYESRPNVTVDAAALCVKSGNAVILRGGKEAIHTNRALHRVLADELVDLRPARARRPARRRRSTARPSASCSALPEFIDLAIPRGGESLIRRVVAEAKMPVLKHYQGNCHVYVDARCDLEMAIKIIVNAKVQRPGVCNAAETLLVHRAIAPAFLPKAAAGLDARGSRAPRRPGRARDRAGDERRRAGRLGHRVSSTRSWPSPSSTRSTRRSPTSPGTARATPRRS